MLERNAWFRALIILGVFAVGLYVAGELWQLASHFGDIIMLFFLSWLLAFILLPIVRFLAVHLRLGMTVAAGAVYLGLLFLLAATLFLVIPLLITQVVQLADELPSVAAGAPLFIQQVQHVLDERHIPVDLSLITGPGLAQEATQLGSKVVENTFGIASSVASGLFACTIILILSFYFVVDGDRIVEGLLAMVPEQYALDARLFVESIDRTFGGFLRGTAIQAAILGVGTGIIMAVAGLSYILLASIVAAIVMLIPFIGSFLALILPLVIAAFSGFSPTHLLLLLVALSALQTLDFNVIAPKVMAENVGLHPLLVFLALLVGIKQAGIAGAIFGVPIAAVIVATFRIFLNRWATPAGSPRLSPDGRVTQAPVSFEQVRAHLNRAITRIFHSKAS